MNLQTHRDNSITWIDFDEAFYPLKWEHLPRHYIIGENTCTNWVCHPTCGWVEISSGENIRLDTGYKSSELFVKMLLERSAAKEVLKTMEDDEKISWAGLQWGTVDHNIRKQEFFLQNNCVTVTKLRLKSLELENKEMKSTICALHAELEESKKMLEDNHKLFSLGTQLSKLKSINKRPSLLAADRFYGMSQVVMPKASTDAIFLGGGLILGGLLASLGINNNKIISGIPNCIPSP